MDKNTTLAFILIGIILVIWLFMNTPKSPVKPIGKETTTEVANDTAAHRKAIAKFEQKIKKEKLALAKKKIRSKTKSLSFGKYFSVSHEKGRIITIENNLVKMELTTKGGDIKKYYLKKFKNWYSASKNDTGGFYETHVQLINYPRGNSGPDLAFVSADGKAINTSKLNFTPNLNKAYYKLTDNDSLVVTFTYKIDANRFIRKIYVLYGDKYSINYSILLKGMNNLISNNTYDLIWKNGIRFVEGNSVDEATYANASAYYGGDHVVVQASKVGEKVHKEFTGRVGWIAVRDKYFTAVMIPNNPSEVEGAYIEGTKTAYKNNGERAYYNISLTVPFQNADVERQSFTLYIGPVDYNILKAHGHNLQELVEFGSFLGLRFLVRPIAEYLLLPLFNFLHLFIPNYGLVIIVFSLIIKLVLYPLTKSSYQSMKKMQLLQPKIAELKEKFKDNPQKMNKETMKLYSTYGVNPAGGCLPLVLQMPIFIALWGLFKVAIELRQQPFIFWIKDLSSPDIILKLSFKIPIFGINEISGLAVLMGVATFVQQKMTVKDPKQKALVYVMPIFLTLMFMGFPSGLNLYYLMFNVFSIGQQYYINHQHDGELLPVKNPKKKKGFMAKLMESAEQNAKTQQRKKR